MPTSTARSITESASHAAPATWSTVPFALLLAGSGCAALIYEIVWFQLLQLVIGASAVSLGLLLAAYMGGLCLGSVLFAKFVSLRHHPVRVYALIELGVALFGLAGLFGVPLVGKIYVAGASEGLPGLILRGLIAAACLLPPTILMGASLPAISRWAHGAPHTASRLGYLYSANIAGAVAGCLFAGFYLLRAFDMAIATYAAVGINVAVALLAFALVGRVAWEPMPDHDAPGIGTRAHRWVLIAIAFSGLTALGAEIVWTRLLSLLLGATVYTFSIILAVFLVGLWAGSSWGSSLAKRLMRPRLALVICQAALAVAIAWTGYTISHSLPFWPVDPWLALNPWFNFELDLARCLWAILPAAVLWGASFPLAIASAATSGEDPARLSGVVYAANTAGSIVGALAFSLILIPTVGTRGSQQLLILLTAAGAVAALISSSLRAARMALAVTATALAAFALTRAVEDVPWQMVAYGRRIAPIMRAFDLYDRSSPTRVLYRGEGLNSSIVIAERAGQRHFYVSGKAEASTAILDMRLERMMGHLPALFHPHPKSVLIVGFGAGVTAGSFVPYPDAENLVICELERQIPPASTEFFGKENNDVFHDRRLRMVYDDARHYIYTTRDKFDVITTDPIHPWVKGTSVLYSKEYYELCKRRLNPGGVVAQWLPIYDSDPETIKTELATFFAVFPAGTVWSNNDRGDGYDLVLIGQAEPSRINLDQLQQRLDRPDYSSVTASLGAVGFHSAVDLLATYAGRAEDLMPLTASAQINQDMNMRLQYMAGLGLNSMSFQKTYEQILALRKFPESLITGTGPRMDALRTMLAAKPSIPSR